MGPNVLFLLSDQHRADWLGTTPELPVRTPTLDALATRGTTFTNAYTPSPVCGPSRACLASGMEYARCGVPNHLYDYPLDQPTFYQLLRDNRVHVIGAGKFDLHKSTEDWALDGSRLLDDWGFSAGIDNEGKRDAVRSGAERPKGPYMAYLHERGLAQRHVSDFEARRTYADTHPTPLPDDAYCDNWIAENALRLLNHAPTDRPWHLTVNFAGPHEPMDVTESMQQRWVDAEFPSPVGGTGDPGAHQRIRRNYAAMIENIDRQVGRLLEAVESRGERDRTIVIYASDHGEMLGDHGLWAKSTWHEASIRIPLLVEGPGVRAGATSHAPVLLHDLAATFLDVAAAAPLERADSRSLWPLLRGDGQPPRAAVVSALDSWRVVTDGRFKLVERIGMPATLFDVTADGSDVANVIERYPDVAASLRSVVAP